MARLAAYYQEDFHYAPVGYGSKQRKAYVLYEEPKNNVLHSSYVNGGPRIRALASSDPTLSPTYSPKTAAMTLKTKPHPFNNNKLVEQSRLAIQRLENLYDSTEAVGPYAVTQLDPEACDCESVYSHNGRGVYDDPYISHKYKSKDKICKRLSYSEAWEGGQYPPEMCAPRNMDRYQGPRSLQVRSFDTVHGETFPVESPYIDHCEEGFAPPISYRSDSSHGRWQQWPWNMPDTRINPALLSPPSPLDSGLSSQSITSSPSLEGEPIHVHPAQMQAIRSNIQHACSCSPCSPRAYAEPGRVISSPGRYDSGRSSPGAYSLTSRGKKASIRLKNAKNLNNGIVYVENDFEEDYSRSQIRYGMLGLIGEPVDNTSTVPKVPNGNYHSMNYSQNGTHATYYYIEEDGTPLKRSGHRSSKSHKSQSSCTRPTVIITEPPEKNSSNPNTSSPDQDISDKSLEPASFTSTTASPSNSSSITSSNDAESEERRKAKKKTEKEIRELEDMYKKCNLGDDIELLERAERRDLQTKLDQCARSLTRSKSDTFFEMASPKHSNPHRSSHRAPYRRAAGVPDVIADDMAIRKIRKPATTSAFNPTENTITYMLCSSHFTPTVPGGKDILYMDSPDVEYDDLSYRKHYFGKKSKITDPQPPFGIPLRPPPPQNVYNDYLHAVPMGGPPPICHPRGNPDVVRDDMAYRTLRKDEPDRIYYDAAEVYKKKRG